MGVGGNDVSKNAPLTLMKYKCFFCGIPKARKTCKSYRKDDEPLLNLTGAMSRCSKQTPKKHEI